MGSGKGGVGKGEGGGGMSTRMLDMFSSEWLATLSAAELQALNSYMSSKYMRSNNMPGTFDAMEGNRINRMLQKSPTTEQSFQVYMPVNKDTMPFLRNIVSDEHGGRIRTPQEFHLHKSTAVESASSTQRIMRFTVQAGSHFGAVTSKGGKGLRAPKVYLGKGKVTRNGVTKDGNTTIYEFKFNSTEF